jgi:hypothetical protein
MFDRVKKFAVAGQKERSIRAAQLNCDFGGCIGGGRGFGGDSRRRTGSIAGVGLHLAVAGEDVRL